MFTGLITDIGTVRAVTPNGDTRLEIATGYDTAAIDLGASIACSGACLTVIETGPDWFAVQVSRETLSATTLGAWHPGTRINLERALKAGDELGGHIVSGHVDDVATVSAVAPDGDSLRLSIAPPKEYMAYIAAKGSVTLDGVSLTVNEAGTADFGVNVIPHTREKTTLGALKPGDRVNLEIDLLARYVARSLGRDRS
ncbi:MAG: riboflavin synthase [Rhodospirillales bacterium]